MSTQKYNNNHDDIAKWLLFILAENGTFKVKWDSRNSPTTDKNGRKQRKSLLVYLFWDSPLACRRTNGTSEFIEWKKPRKVTTWEMILLGIS